MALGLYISKPASSLKELERTSSLHTFVICGECGRKEKNKSDLAKHLRSCVANRTCSCCNIVFRNRGNLFNHITHLFKEKARNGKDLRTVSSNYMCTVCPKGYTQLNNLKFHIRREHFNLVARISEVETRELNEVWLERVRNCDAVVEIKKAKLNKLIMKKAPTNHTLQISEPNVSIDRTQLYPTHFRKHRIWCNVDQKTYNRRDYDLHMTAKHENKE